MDSDQIERLEKHRKLPAEGQFLAGAETYDEHGRPLPTGTVPVRDPRQRPTEGDIVDDIDEQRAEAPEAPVSATHAGSPKPDTDAAEQTIHTDPSQ